MYTLTRANVVSEGDLNHHATAPCGTESRVNVRHHAFESRPPLSAVTRPSAGH